MVNSPTHRKPKYANKEAEVNVAWLACTSEYLSTWIMLCRRSNVIGQRTSTESCFLHRLTTMYELLNDEGFSCVWQVVYFYMKGYNWHVCFIVDGAVLTADMYAIKLIKWSKGEEFVSGNWEDFQNCEKAKMPFEYVSLVFVDKSVWASSIKG